MLGLVFCKRSLQKKNATRGEMAFFHALGSGQRKKETTFSFYLLAKSGKIVT
jgi:hypothetical protein